MAMTQNAYIVYFNVSNVYYFFGLIPSFFKYKGILVKSRNMSIGDKMAKCITIDEFGVYCTSDDIFGGCDDWDEDIGVSRTDDEYIISNDNLLEGI